MEYLMTYGWAILIIAVVLGALFQLGVFNSSSFSPRAPPGACQVFRPGGPGTVTNINLMGVCTGQLPQYVGGFNGQASQIDISPFPNLDLQNSLSVSVWVNYRAVPQAGVILWKSIALNPQYGLGDIYGAQSGFSYWWTKGGIRYQSPYLSITTGTWTQIVLTYDGSNFRLYMNGVDTGVTTAVAAPLDSFIASNLLIGKRNQVAYSPFSGIISNIQIYNASLSANQVQALFLEGMGGAPMKLQNLVGWWPLNGNANDYSGNNNNGVPTAVTFTSQYGK